LESERLVLETRRRVALEVEELAFESIAAALDPQPEE
jgi:hypothetical protein